MEVNYDEDPLTKRPSQMLLKATRFGDEKLMQKIAEVMLYGGWIRAKCNGSARVVAWKSDDCEEEVVDE